MEFHDSKSSKLAMQQPSYYIKYMYTNMYTDTYK